MATENDTSHCVYRIVCFANGKCYIGMTNDAKRRKNDHFGNLKRNEHGNPHLQSAYNKYGRKSFYFEVIESDLSYEDVRLREMHWISHFDSYNNGFNMTLGGDDRTGIQKTCTWNGIEYPSQKAAAKALGITTWAIGSRLAKGYKCDEDVGAIGGAKKFSWNGVEYVSITAASEALGVNSVTLTEWRKKGWACDADRNTVTWNGVGYLNIAEAARANGVIFETMRRLISQGYTCDDEVKSGNGKPVTWNGIDYPSITSLSKAIGTSVSVMCARIKKGYTSDADMEKAKLKPIIKKGKSVVWDGNEYRSVAEAARAMGISPSSMRSRIERGHTCNADVGREVPTTWNGIQYPSYKTAAEANGVGIDCMMDRIAKGYTCDADVPRTGKSVIWNGIEYRSVHAAAKALNIPHMTMVLRVRRGWASDSEVIKKSTKTWSSQYKKRKRA